MPDNKSQPTARGETTRVPRQAEGVEKCIVSTAGLLVKVHAQEYNLRSWFTRTGELADRRRRGSRESSGST
jgi:hypothetical protein